MKRNLVIAIAILLISVLTACGNDEANQGEVEDIKELVHEYTVGHFDDVSASITSHELIVHEDGDETVYDLPEDEFFVSIAPFITETHECDIHSLTGCQGELVEEEFDVYIQDEDGNVIVDEKIATFENGFIDLWLPRDKTFEVKISQDGKMAKSEISTFENDNTCITTMQLVR